MDDSEVSLNVCLGKQFSGGELYFRGVRCDHHVNSESVENVFLLISSPLIYSELQLMRFFTNSLCRKIMITLMYLDEPFFILDVTAMVLKLRLLDTVST